MSEHETAAAIREHERHAEILEQEAERLGRRGEAWRAELRLERAAAHRRLADKKKRLLGRGY
jgi:hypothetical protein